MKSKRAFNLLHILFLLFIKCICHSYFVKWLKRLLLSYSMTHLINWSLFSLGWNNFYDNYRDSYTNIPHLSLTSLEIRVFSKTFWQKKDNQKNKIVTLRNVSSRSNFIQYLNGCYNQNCVKLNHMPHFDWNFITTIM